MHLYANGCSYTYGYGLVAQTESQEADSNYMKDKRLALTWPFQLAELLGQIYDCPVSAHNLARSGSSNDRILRTTLTWADLHHHENPIAVIQWSRVDRHNLFSNSKQYWVNATNKEWSLSKLPEDEQKTAWDFYKHFTNEYESTTRTLVSMISLQNFFKAQGIPHLFFYGLPMNFHVYDKGEAPKLLALLDERYFYQEKKWHATTMFDVLVQHGPDFQMPCGHPSAAGHRMWAETLTSEVERIINIGL